MLRIYQPPPNVMQAGKGKTKEWCVTFGSNDPLVPEPLMGWVSSQDMKQELRLVFPSLVKALHFARVNGFDYTVYNSTKKVICPQRYEHNFTCSRIRQ